MMKNLYLCSCSSFTFPTLHPHHQLSAGQRERGTNFTLHAAAKSGGVFSLNSCKTCKGQGAIECPGCKGTGKNKKNGNMFERWKMQIEFVHEGALIAKDSDSRVVLFVAKED
ncbi:hypothetical protein ACJIZ3_003049 [Penstemon smallii]|uniref:Uncharacterized protein n=1 Tax=Penstemon smallii TaxID=265156 RepID=A0ABD3U873_9LAMI